MPRMTGFDPVPIRGPRKLPLIGAPASIFRFLGDPIGTMLALNREFGDIAAVVDQSPAIVCVFGAERNREVLSNGAVFRNDEDFLRAPKGSSVERIKSELVFLNGEPHRRHRRLMMPAFQKSSIDAYASEIVAATEPMLQRWPVGETVDVTSLLRQLTLCVAVRCLFGLNVTDGAQELGVLAEELVDQISSPLAMMLPYPIPATPFHRALKACDQLVVKLQNLIEEKRRQPEGRPDVLSMMIRAHDDDGTTFTDEELIGEVTGLFIAGHDTTAKTLGWTLFLLEQHPEALAGVLDEMDAVLRGGAPTAEHVPQLVLLDRVVKESMRLLSAAPTLFLRVCAEKVPLGPYSLPEGANVVMSPLVTHRDEARFPEPFRFRPERWEKLQPTIYEYLPFGAGPRMCLGASFATLALRVMLPMILQRYRLTLAHGARISRHVRANVLGPKHGLPMLVARQDRRLSRNGGVRGDIHELVDLS
jgi:cytochrome P450